MNRLKFVSVFILLIALKNGFSQNLIVFVEPLGEYTWAKYSFDGLLDLGIKNVNNKTLYPKAEFSPHFSPGFFLKAVYNRFTFKFGITFFNDLFAVSRHIFLRGFATQYDGNGNPRYYLGDGFVKRDEQIMFGMDKEEIYLGLNYALFKHIAIGLLYHKSTHNIYKDNIKDIHGVAIDTLGSYVNHNHIINSYFLTVSFKYNFKTLGLRLEAMASPYSSYLIEYNQGKKPYKGYAYRLSAVLKWKSLFLNYYYSAYYTEQNLFFNRGHSLRFGFSWEILKLDVSKIDIFN